MAFSPNAKISEIPKATHSTNAAPLTIRSLTIYTFVEDATPQGKLGERAGTCRNVRERGAASAVLLFVLPGGPARSRTFSLVPARSPSLFALASLVTVGYKPFRRMPWCVHSRLTATQDAGRSAKTSVSFVL